MTGPSSPDSANNSNVRSGCSRRLLARKAREKLRLLNLGEGIEALFPDSISN